MTVPERRAGGTDIMERRRSGVLSASTPIVLSESAEVLAAADDALTVGAAVRLARLAADPTVRERYAGLAQAAGRVATPQVRARATVGGNVLQRTRCPYFRMPAFSGCH